VGEKFVTVCYIVNYFLSMGRCIQAVLLVKELAQKTSMHALSTRIYHTINLNSFFGLVGVTKAKLPAHYANLYIDWQLSQLVCH